MQQQRDWANSLLMRKGDTSRRRASADDLTDETRKHILPPVGVVPAGAKRTKMVFKDETSGKLSRTVEWITEAILDVFLERISDANASHWRGSICAVEAAVLTFSD